jgi:hypothetical protein
MYSAKGRHRIAACRVGIIIIKCHRKIIILYSCICEVQKRKTNGIDSVLEKACIWPYVSPFRITQHSAVGFFFAVMFFWVTILFGIWGGYVIYGKSESSKKHLGEL